MTNLPSDQAFLPGVFFQAFFSRRFFSRRFLRPPLRGRACILRTPN
nr:MAG TPA: hypothetical protein [Inoviridae sp.]